MRTGWSMANMPCLLKSLVRGDFSIHHHHVSCVAVVDADKDIEEMKEVFARQEEIILGRARQMKEDENDKENCKLSTVGNKRVADDDTVVGRRKAVLVEKALS